MQQKNTDSLLQWEDICEFNLKDRVAVVHANIKQRNGRGKFFVLTNTVNLTKSICAETTSIY
jgi:hypothetical protein